LNNIIEIACSVIFTVCAFLKHWAGMYKDEEKSNLLKTHFAGEQRGSSGMARPHAGTLMITEG
jgi:hypothetical protein